jgi:ribosome-binding factor A
MTKRIPRVNELIKREISEILLREIEFPKDTLVTVTRVETLNDLKESKIWVSVFPEDQRERVIKILNRQIYDIQQRINHLLRMRPIPKLKFVEEKQTSQAGKIEEILQELKKD